MVSPQRGRVTLVFMQFVIVCVNNSQTPGKRSQCVATEHNKGERKQQTTSAKQIALSHAALEMSYHT